MKKKLLIRTNKSNESEIAEPKLNLFKFIARVSGSKCKDNIN
ncbi:MAG: hypothetical protein RLZZ507_3486 [Cyanobacteriota bacterium]|jgi:hypothetical protein